MVPLAPTAGVVHVQPGAEIDANRSDDGNGSDTTMLVAGLGPLFVTVNVY